MFGLLTKSYHDRRMKIVRDEALEISKLLSEQVVDLEKNYQQSKSEAKKLDKVGSVMASAIVAWHVDPTPENTRMLGMIAEALVETRLEITMSKFKMPEKENES